MKVSKTLPAIQSQIDKLESAGYEVSLKFYPDNGGVIHGDHQAVTPYMGLTHMEILSPTGKVHVFGQGFCGVNDHWCRAEGTKAAFNRVMHNLSLNIGREKVKSILG